MDKAKLLARRVPTGTVDIPGVGEVTVRGLTRAELLTAESDKGPLVTEQRVLALAMVDPEMTEADVKAWQDASVANEINPVIEKVNALSGIADNSAKEAYKSV